MNFFGDELYSEESYVEEDKEYTGQEIFDEFLTYLTDYKLEFDRVIIENGENRFTVFAPDKDASQNYVFYEGCEGSTRFSCTATNIKELLEEVINVVGEEKINLKQKRKNI